MPSFSSTFSLTCEIYIRAKTNKQKRVSRWSLGFHAPPGPPRLCGSVGVDLGGKSPVVVGFVRTL